MTVRRLNRAERLQLAAACIVGVSLLLPWYTVDPNVAGASVHGRSGDVVGWAAHPVLRWVLAVAVGAAFLSAWQSLTGQVPTNGFERGEMSAVVALACAGTLMFIGWVDRPGHPRAAIDLGYGWFVAIGATLVALGAAIARMPPPKRTPPGM